MMVNPNFVLFAGTLEDYKLDSKGRLSLPTKWRERLGKEFYLVAVTVRGCKCLRMYTVDYFNETYYKYSQIKNENQREDILSRFLENAEETTLDAQGRFTVNPRLKTASNFSNDTTVTFKGKGKVIEIWSTEELEKFNGSMDKSYDDSVGIFDMVDKAHLNEQANEQDSETE